jgi:hypothetical protein
MPDGVDEIVGDLGCQSPWCGRECTEGNLRVPLKFAIGNHRDSDVPILTSLTLCSSVVPADPDSFLGGSEFGRHSIPGITSPTFDRHSPRPPHPFGHSSFRVLFTHFDRHLSLHVGRTRDASAPVRIPSILSIYGLASPSSPDTLCPPFSHVLLV